MTHAPGRFPRIVLTSLALACVVLAGCHEDAVAPKTIDTPQGPSNDLGTYIVDVNLRTRTVTAHPMVSGSLNAPNGVSAAIYGSAPLIGHKFSLDGGAPSAGNTYILRDRIENNLTFPIGTHVPHALGVFPQDTMGVYVFVSINPVVEAGCTPDPVTCAVALDSGYDGAYTFTGAIPQPYMFFKTILESTDGVALSGLDYSDQTGSGGLDYSRSLAFRASSGVTDFHFGVTVSAPWVKPHETQWTVRYARSTNDTMRMPNRLGTTLDSLRATPDWRVASLDAKDSSIANAFCPASSQFCLRTQNGTPNTTGTPPDSIIYFRSDSLGAPDSAYIEATILTSGLKAGNPSVFLGMNDGTKSIRYGFANGQSGFVTTGNVFITAANTTVTASDWRIEKFGTDSALAIGDGTILARVPYSALPPAPLPSARYPYFWFGQRVKGAVVNNPINVASEWVDVSYAIGAVSP